MRGIVPSLNTPFLENGPVDHKSLRRLVEHTVGAGCGGMRGLAVAGEHSNLSLDEKVQFIETVTATNARRIPFIVGVTTPDFDASLQLAMVAKSAGAIGISVQLPSELGRPGNLGFLQDLGQHAPDMLMLQDLDWAGGGLALDEIVYHSDNVEKFTWLKIETQRAGPKYSAVLGATGGKLSVFRGRAVGTNVLP